MKTFRKQSGFTLAELLIVVAIIGVLIAISMPVFGAQREKANIAVDQATMRSAYAVLIADYLTGDAAANKTYYYDPAASALASGSAAVAGYGKAKSDAADWWTGDGTASGVPNPNGSAPAVLSLTIDDNGNVTFRWGGGIIRAATTISQRNALSAEQRLAEDEKLLNALQDEIRSMTYAEFFQYLNWDEYKYKNEEGITIAVESAKNSINNNHRIESAFTNVFERIGIDSSKVNNKEELLLLATESGNDVKIQVDFGERLSTIYNTKKDSDEKLGQAVVYLGSGHGEVKDGTQYESLNLAHRKS